MDHADRLLGRIHAEKIRPVPRWIVLARRLSRALLFLLVLVLLSLSFALLFQEWHAHPGPGWIARRLFARMAPWIWVVTCAVGAWGAWTLFRELPRAWRLRPWLVIAGIVVFGAGSGFALERTDALLRVHRLVAHLVPAYRQVWQTRALETWNDPASGRLGGTLQANGFVRVEGRRWALVWEDSSRMPAPGPVRLSGRVLRDSIFVVQGWMPAPGMGPGRHEGGIGKNPWKDER